MEMAKHEEKVGIDYLDLNIGPSRKAGQEIMDWIVKLVQGVVNKPMSLDTTNPRVWYWALMDYGSALKNAIPNPNRRSAHYTKQSKFVGSDRQIRGMILRSLVTNPQQDEKELVRSISVSEERAHRVIDRLAKEGFISRNGTTLMIGDS